MRAEIVKLIHFRLLQVNNHIFTIEAGVITFSHRPNFCQTTTAIR